jgi:hypothetical protein
VSVEILEGAALCVANVSALADNIKSAIASFNLDPNQLRLPGEWTIDFLKASVKSIRQNIGAFVITSSGFPYVFCAPRETDEYSTRAIT